MDSEKPVTLEKAKSTPRGRRERPCDACRRRKSKCVINEGQTVCAACGVHGQTCTYLEDPQPRKRKVEGQGLEGEVSKKRSIVSSTPKANDGTPSIKVETAAPSVTTESVQSPFTQDGNAFSSQQHYGSHIGPTTELEPLLLDLSMASGNSTPNGTYNRADSRTAFLKDPNFTPSISASRANAPQTMERIVGPYRSALLQSYMTTIHPNFPIVDSEALQEIDANPTSSDPALLAAIYTLTIPWLNHESLKKRPAPAPEIHPVEELAFDLFRESLQAPTLSTIQTGLLLMQRPNIDSKTLNTQLVSVAHELGLHLDCTHWASPPSDKGLRRRLAWALYIQDKWCSLIHGRPSMITKSNWAVPDLVDDDFDATSPEPPTSATSTQSSGGSVADEETPRGRELFKQMVKLTEILAMVLDTFFTLQAMREIDDAAQGGTKLILEKAKPVQIKLKEWFAKLPANLKMDSATSGKPLSTGYLHLAYFATEITLHRSIIRSLHPTPLPPTTTTTTSPSPSSSSPYPNPTRTDPYLQHICRSAAKTRLISAMDFTNRLRAEHLAAFWYFASKTNFALIGTFGALLLATAPCFEEAEFYRRRLEEYRWTLGVSGRGRGMAWVGSAVRSLEGGLRLVGGLKAKPMLRELMKDGGGGVGRGAGGGGGQGNGGRAGSEEGVGTEGEAGSGALEGLATTNGPSAHSGLISPSTSTSSGDISYEAFADSFASGGGGSGFR